MSINCCYLALCQDFEPMLSHTCSVPAKEEPSYQHYKTLAQYLEGPCIVAQPHLSMYRHHTTIGTCTGNRTKHSTNTFKINPSIRKVPELGLSLHNAKYLPSIYHHGTEFVLYQNTCMILLCLLYLNFVLSNTSAVMYLLGLARKYALLWLFSIQIILFWVIFCLGGCNITRGSCSQIVWSPTKLWPYE